LGLGGPFIENPDEISVNLENTTSLFYRASTPPANDLPCNSQNQFHVTRYYAWVRGRVAGAANEMTSARCWLTISADLGFAPGQSLLAALLIRSSPPDYPSAFRLASQAAAQGDVLGELQLAGMYREGKGTAPDAAKAQFWSAQAQRSQDLVAWQRMNTKNGAGLSMMDVLGFMGEVWETLVTTPLSPEAAAAIRAGEYKSRTDANRAFQ
jgi:TPR repeat protein